MSVKDKIQPTKGTSRRTFLRQLSIASAGIGIAACSEGSGDGRIAADSTVTTADESSWSFTHGVASGDPLSDRVILWTRFAPLAAPPNAASRQSQPEVSWQLASDQDFGRIVAGGSMTVSADSDYIAKVDADGLAPDQTYFFRFVYGGKTSPVGRTKTLPNGSPEEINLAIFSCSNYPAGYFHAYADAARDHRIDFALHLGDYIYEYAPDGYASEDAEALGRVSSPAGELITLGDYRARYAQYRSDPDLQALHGAMPMIIVWDDHELANDTWRDGAQNHQPESEGSFADRRAAAFQAWAEWMPVRMPDQNRPEKIYRSFEFGDLLTLHMLDTRNLGRDEQLSYASYLDSGGFNAQQFAADVFNPDRSLLGTEQESWLQGQMAASTATWQILGQQVLMGRMSLPAPIVTQQIDVGGYGRLIARAQQAPQTLTPEEQALLSQPSIPYNLDAWDGYAAARERLQTMAAAMDKNLVCVAGDTHNAWANNLLDPDGNAIGVEFAAPSVSSPGFEAFFPDADPREFAAGVEALIDPLRYFDASQRGYLKLQITQQAVDADFVFVSNVKRRSFEASTGRQLRVCPGASNRKLIERD